jgi:hypothetical protein
MAGEERPAGGRQEAGERADDETHAGVGLINTGALDVFAL